MSDQAHLRLTTPDDGLRFSVHVGRFMMTLDSGPDAMAASPVQAVLAALGGCSAMDVISILRKKRQQVTDYEVILTGERREAHPRAFTRIEILHRVTGRDVSPAAVAEALRLSDTTYCSVHAMLQATVEITSRFEILPA